MRATASRAGPPGSTSRYSTAAKPTHASAPLRTYGAPLRRRGSRCEKGERTQPSCRTSPANASRILAGIVLQAAGSDQHESDQSVVIDRDAELGRRREHEPRRVSRGGPGSHRRVDEVHAGATDVPQGAPRRRRFDRDPRTLPGPAPPGDGRLAAGGGEETVTATRGRPERATSRLRLLLSDETSHGVP